MKEAGPGKKYIAIQYIKYTFPTFLAMLNSKKSNSFIIIIYYNEFGKIFKSFGRNSPTFDRNSPTFGRISPSLDRISPASVCTYIFGMFLISLAILCKIMQFLMKSVVPVRETRKVV